MAMNGNLNALLIILYVYELALEWNIISMISLQFGILMPHFIGN